MVNVSYDYYCSVCAHWSHRNNLSLVVVPQFSAMASHSGVRKNACSVLGPRDCLVPRARFPKGPMIS
jgi:hypothetical protein